MRTATLLIALAATAPLLTACQRDVPLPTADAAVPATQPPSAPSSPTPQPPTFPPASGPASSPPSDPTK